MPSELTLATVTANIGPAASIPSHNEVEPYAVVHFTCPEGCRTEIATWAMELVGNVSCKHGWMTAQTVRVVGVKFPQLGAD